MSDIRSYLPLWGQWNTEELIGEGQDSKVYRAVCQTPQGTQYAAVKQIYVAPTEDPAQSERKARTLLAQADRRISLCGKPHLVEYYERKAYRRADGGYDIFVRMELLTSLRSVMGKTEFSEAMLSQLGQEATAALLTLEQAQTCHGAIHPANIFLSKDGTYKLGDYCQSRVRTTSGGAREYLAPEVLTGGSLPSANSDRYALGMVLYRLSNALRAPFLPPAPTPVNREALMQAERCRLRGETLPAPTGAGSRMSTILLRACAFAPENRYQSTSAMQHDFSVLQNEEAALEAAAPSAEQPLTAEQQPKKKEKKSPVFGIGIILAAVILIAGGITAAVLVKAQQAQQPETVGQETAAMTVLTQPEGTTAPLPTEMPATEAAATEAPTTQAPTTEPPTEAAHYEFALSSTYRFVDFEIPATGYIIADSNTRYITQADLVGMTKNQCRLACNEIFARKGRLFSSKTIADYFNAMPWYNGSVQGSYFDSHINDYLTEIEQENVRVIVQYEKSKGWS